jgi:hypothetical protein
MTDTEETTLRDMALTHAINCGTPAPDIVSTAEKFLDFLKGLTNPQPETSDAGPSGET